MTDQEQPDQPDPFAPSYAEYSGAELLEQSQGNAQAALIATVAFLQERGIPIAEWAAALGRSFSAEWGEPEAWAADEFLDAMLANYRSLGATVSSTDLSADRAEAVIAGFPDPAQCARFGVELAAAATFHDSAAPIAAACGLVWSWELTEPDTAGTRLRVSKAEAR